MIAVGVTGGVASGKSTVARWLAERLEAGLFDADACVRSLLAGDVGVRDEVRAAFGDESLDGAGWPDRAWLRGRVFRDATQRRVLEEILHPRVREAWLAALNDAENALDSRFYVVEIPLLYETGSQTRFDRVVVAACTAEEQRRRLRLERGLEDRLIDGILEAQWRMSEKIRRSDHVIWTGGAMSLTEEQTTRLALHWRG